MRPVRALSTRFHKTFDSQHEQHIARRYERCGSGRGSHQNMEVFVQSCCFESHENGPCGLRSRGALPLTGRPVRPQAAKKCGEITHE